MPFTRSSRSRKADFETTENEVHKKNSKIKAANKIGEARTTRQQFKNLTNSNETTSTNLQKTQRKTRKMRTLRAGEVAADPQALPKCVLQLKDTDECPDNDENVDLDGPAPAKKSKTDCVDLMVANEQKLTEVNTVHGSGRIDEGAQLEANKTNVSNDKEVIKPYVAEESVAYGEQLKELAATTSDGNEPSTSKQSKISLITQTPHNTTATTTQKPTRAKLPAQLQIVLSDLYLNASKRLCLIYPPRCVEDLAYCHKHHYRASPPEEPSHTLEYNLCCALKQQRYVSFINYATDMCHRRELPKMCIFTKIIELLLSINVKAFNNAVLLQSYNKSIELFSLLVCSFPPCWLAMRPLYIDFFQRPLDATKLTTKNKQLISKSTKIFAIILDLLENTLNVCPAEMLHETAVTETIMTDITTSSTPITPIKSCADKATGDDQDNSENQLTSPPNSSDLTACSEFYSQWEWEERESRLQTFEALNPGIRLKRLFVCLRLLLQILESDLVMWILHHHKKTKDWIFDDENRPLIVLVFELTQYTRLTGVVRRLFNLFAIAANKGVGRERLQIFERYIALLMVASNTADMENTVIGVKYPYLGVKTKTLIREFFKIFKVHNTANITTYIETIEILRIPFVRYEFIDHFLQIFYFSHTEEMSPKKIAYDMAKKRWLKYKPQAELQTSDEDLSREQYLKLLLLALEAYCDWHSSKRFLHLITNNTDTARFRTTTDSKHRWPTHESTDVLLLKKMAKDLGVLEQKLKMTVRMSKPKVDLPLVDICIDEEIITKYRNDLKFVMILHDLLPKQIAMHGDVNFKTWQLFLNDFAPK